MSVAPIVHSLIVKAPPARAFDLFTQRMAAWWGGGIGKAPFVEIVIEPHVGGRWYERDAQGVETQWGDVLAWEPPARALFAWRINSQWKFDPDFLTEVELMFAPAEGGGSRVTLEHRYLERYGADAEAHAAKLRGGWPTKLRNYAQYTDGN